MVQHYHDDTAELVARIARGELELVQRRAPRRFERPSTQWLAWSWISAFSRSRSPLDRLQNDATSGHGLPCSNHHNDLLERSAGMAMILPNRAIMAVDFVDSDA
jgi:hypothetical protein